ncbi:unnamed protein product [Linum tenue]|uniref:Uncharacterized protein n=1 Tax=Linum tenue TaxID=586396 RepID=A0AAV0MF06_9ROSI|nr:unnamed protein product [Linum tenue]CAI0444629.1 unnamed protein product [Linum tenue]
MAVYKPAKRESKTEYKHRTFERQDPSDQFRLLACFHSSRNIPGLINLIEASRGTEKRQGLCVYAFCESADRKRAAMIILPFHKHQRVDGTLETTRIEFRSVNRRVLERATCSVAILVDRGFGGSTHVAASNVSSSITMLFFGGKDDREALAYGARMAEHPGISLTVMRYVAGQNSPGEISTVDLNDGPDSSGISDGEYLAEFRKRIREDGSIKYEEKVVNNPVETAESIRGFSKCNLFLVGRSPEGPVAACLSAKIECSELGSVGNFLTSPEFVTSASVLVVQQYSTEKRSTPRHSTMSSGKVAELPAGEMEEGKMEV